tara:strand:- start:16905 stop:17888 length:984 start_codon:yes stop_codon:yes gene_type:complete
MKTRTFTIVAGSIMGIMSTLTAATTHTENTVLSPCFDQFIEDLQTCNTEFDNEYGDWGTHNNPTAYRACRDAAALNHQSCLGGFDESLFRTAFNDFRSNLESCLTNFPAEGDREAREDCIAAALAEYRDEVQDIIDDQPTGIDCTPVLDNILLLNPIASLEAAGAASGNPSGKYSTQVNTTLNFSAGINPMLGQQYDTAQIACLQQALSIAIYQTKLGFQVVPFDADTDTSDGSVFNLHLIAGDLVHANEVSILNIFYDENNLPVLGELSTIEIENSPMTGDWNRDEVLNSQDIIDFLASYDAQAQRADLNDDEAVTPEDVEEFTAP